MSWFWRASGVVVPETSVVVGRSVVAVRVVVVAPAVASSSPVLTPPHPAAARARAATRTSGRAAGPDAVRRHRPSPLLRSPRTAGHRNGGPPPAPVAAPAT